MRLGVFFGLVLVALHSLGCGSATSSIASPNGTAPSLTMSGAPTTSPPVLLTVETKPITIGFVGDLMFARDVVTLMETEGRSYPFELVREMLAGTDLLVGNLEGTFTTRGEPLSKQYTFRAPPELAIALADAGFDAVSLGNNHAFDFGTVGLFDTLTALQAADVPWFGAGMDEARARAPLVVTVGGSRVAFLGYSGVGESGFASRSTPGVARASAEAITTDVKRAVESADHVMVVMHAGTEYTAQPSEWQLTLAHAAIDAGADVVVGHHPHVLQPWERYGDGLILYSLGNFVFDLDPDDMATLGSGPFQTAVAVITLSSDAQPEVAFRPAFIDPLENRPRPPTAEEARDILRALRRRSGE